MSPHVWLNQDTDTHVSHVFLYLKHTHSEQMETWSGDDCWPLRCSPLHNWSTYSGAEIFIQMKHNRPTTQTRQQQQQQEQQHLIQTHFPRGHGVFLETCLLTAKSAKLLPSIWAPSIGGQSNRFLNLEKFGPTLGIACDTASCTTKKTYRWNGTSFHRVWNHWGIKERRVKSVWLWHVPAG